MDALTDPSAPVFCLCGGEASSVPSSSALVSGGMRAPTALRRRILVPTLQGLVFISVVCFFLFFVFRFGLSVFVGREWSAPAERVLVHAMLSFGDCSLRWWMRSRYGDRFSPVSRVPKMVWGEGLTERWSSGLAWVIRWWDLRRRREAVLTRGSRDVCPLDGEDCNMCPSSKKTDLRGGRAHLVWSLGFLSSWTVCLGPIEELGLLGTRFVLGLTHLF